jgi:amino acid transporter
MGVIGSAKLLQALARDHLIPGLSLFGQGTKKSDEPIYAVCITYVIAQVTMFADINQIASFITMTVCYFFLHLCSPFCVASRKLHVGIDACTAPFTLQPWHDAVACISSEPYTSVG